jgi:hypothetical protein
MVTRIWARVLLHVLILGLPGAGLLSGCTSLVDDDEGSIPNSEIPVSLQGDIPERGGYLEEQPVDYFEFGHLVPSDASWFPSYLKGEFPGMPVREMYVWSDGDKDTKDNGTPLDWNNAQHPIIDTLPLQAGYTGYFEIVKFFPEGKVNANDIKSRGTLLLSEIPLQYTGRIVHCPVVGQNAVLKKRSKRSWQATHSKVKVWYRKQAAHCMLMEGGVALLKGGAAPPRTFATEITETRTLYQVASAKVYMLRASAFSGADRVSNIAVPNNSVFLYHDDPRSPVPPSTVPYTPVVKIYDVTVPSDYKHGQFRSYLDINPLYISDPDFDDPNSEERSPEAFANLSIVAVGKKGEDQ